MITVETLLASGWTILGTELQAVGLLDDQWIPVRQLDPPPSAEDIELVELFSKLEHHVMRHGVRAAEKHAVAINDVLGLLDPAQRQNVNSTLLALWMLHHWSTETAGPLAVLVRSKTGRLIDRVRMEVIEHAGQETALFTYRCADDFHRLATGRPALSKELRDKLAARYLKHRRTA